MKNTASLTLSEVKTTNTTNFVARSYQKMLREFIKGRMGYATIAIIGQSCLGSAAAMFLLMGELATQTKMTLLFFITIFCMAFNGAVLAQLKAKVTFNILILSFLFSTLVILIHLF